MKKAIITVLKTLLTIGIFVSLFWEFGAGTVEVPRAGLADGTIFYQPNPAMPGFVGRMKARFSGGQLPEAQIPLEGSKVCDYAMRGEAVFVKTTGGEIVRMRAPHHCHEGKLDRVLASADTK